MSALTKPTRYGSVDDVRRQVLGLAAALNVADRIQIVETLTAAEIGRADIVTNSGHLRPLDAAFVGQMKPGAAIPLMYESWELRPGEVDVEACKKRGIRLAGTNECHPEIRVFEYLGMLALFGLFQCRVPTCFSRILLICDNPFGPHIARTLLACQAEVEVLGDTVYPDTLGVTRRRVDAPSTYDAVVVADTPGPEPVLGRQGTARYTLEQIGDFPALVQLWGDVDRTCLPEVTWYPVKEPAKGHMGILLSEIGPDPVIRLQAGGLKVGELLACKGAVCRESIEYCQPLF